MTTWVESGPLLSLLEGKQKNTAAIMDAEAINKEPIPTQMKRKEEMPVNKITKRCSKISFKCWKKVLLLDNIITTIGMTLRVVRHKR